jgi:hypothetical protein
VGEKNILDASPSYEGAADFRPQITHECVCGCRHFRIVATFDEYEISSYFLDMECVNCGSRYYAPTPIDGPE